MIFELPKDDRTVGGKARIRAMGTAAKKRMKIAPLVTLAFWRLYLALCAGIFMGI